MDGLYKRISELSKQTRATDQTFYLSFLPHTFHTILLLHFSFHLTAHLFFRRTRFSIRKKIDDIRTPNDEKTTTNASVESKVETDLESKVDIELLDNGKDNLVGEQTAEITVK